MQSSKIDPTQELARIKQSIAALESHILHSTPKPIHVAPPLYISEPLAKGQHTKEGVGDGRSVPGMLAPTAQGGLYTGPTSAATHLMVRKNFEGYVIY